MIKVNIFSCMIVLHSLCFSFTLLYHQERLILSYTYHSCFFFLFIRQCQLSAYSYVNYISYYIQSLCKKTSSLYLYFFALLYFVLMFFSHASITRCGNCKLTCVSLGLCQTFSCNSLLFFSS